MFPRLRDRFDAAVDIVVEFSTLGEFGYGAPAPQRTIAPSSGSDHEPGMGGAGATPEEPLRFCGERTGRAAARNAPAGGAASVRCEALTGPAPAVQAATPAGRRLSGGECASAGRAHASATRRCRPAAPAPVCLDAS